MTRRIRRSLGWALLGAAPLAAAPEFSGVLTAPGIALFALEDSQSGAASRWLRTGQEFEGFAVVEYLPASATLVLRSASGLTRLPLRAEKVSPAPPPTDEMMIRATQEVERAEHWTAPIRFQGPHLFKGQWLVVAHHEKDGRTETRIVVFGADGGLRDYQRL